MDFVSEAVMRSCKDFFGATWAGLGVDRSGVAVAPPRRRAADFIQERRVVGISSGEVFAAGEQFFRDMYRRSYIRILESDVAAT